VKSLKFLGHLILCIPQIKDPYKILIHLVILHIMWNPQIQVSTNMFNVVKPGNFVPTILKVPCSYSEWDAADVAALGVHGARPAPTDGWHEQHHGGRLPVHDGHETDSRRGTTYSSQWLLVCKIELFLFQTGKWLKSSGNLSHQLCNWHVGQLTAFPTVPSTSLTYEVYV